MTTFIIYFVTPHARLHLHNYLLYKTSYYHAIHKTSSQNIEHHTSLQCGTAVVAQTCTPIVPTGTHNAYALAAGAFTITRGQAKQNIEHHISLQCGTAVVGQTFTPIVPTRTHNAYALAPCVFTITRGQAKRRTTRCYNMRSERTMTNSLGFDLTILAWHSFMHFYYGLTFANYLSLTSVFIKQTIHCFSLLYPYLRVSHSYALHEQRKSRKCTFVLLLVCS